jgi:Flp pilus assembly protein TadG
MYKRPHSLWGSSPQRRGAATVELALCLPFLITVTFGMLEYNNVVMLKSRMLSAAYESARLATRPSTSENTAATAKQVTAYGNSLLVQLGVNRATVSLTPGDLSTATPQTVVTVSVSAPFGQNSLTTLVVGSSTTITSSATLIVE